MTRDSTVTSPGRANAQRPAPRHPNVRAFWRSTVKQRLIDAADRRVAAVAHLSIGFGVFVGVGFLAGLAINLVIWLRSRRSSFVEFHSEQAGTYQLVEFMLTFRRLAAGVRGRIGMP